MMPRNCSLTSNIQCLTKPPCNAYVIAQPSCVITPENQIEPNPYFDRDNNLSYWGYSVQIQCNAPYDPLGIYIPLSSTIDENSLNVQERILSCGIFTDVPYTFTDSQGITPEEGLQFINIPVNMRYSTGATLYYRLIIEGDFTPDTSSLYIETSDGNLITFDGNYIVPGEGEIPNLSLTKDSEVVIDNNNASINYRVDVTNAGNITLSNVLYMDTINYDGIDITIGPITVSPEEIDVDTSTNGIIILSGNLGDLSPGETFTINYTLPLVSFAAPDTYTFMSITQARSGSIVSTINTSAQIGVVEFLTSNICGVTSPNSASFRITLSSIPNSPPSQVIISTVLTIPEGIVVNFTSFDMCTAVFLDTLEPVPLNTDISGSQILLTCPSSLPTGASMSFDISFMLISTTSINPLPLDITASIDTVKLLNPNTQVSLGASPLPNIAILKVGGEALCTND